MIHTDGTRTIANAGPLPEARESEPEPERTDHTLLADTLVSDEEALD